MQHDTYVKITHETLRLRLEIEKPDNEDRYQGFALVNVLSPEAFEKEHIPGSINIPKGNEDEFEARFAKDKEIVVYCASMDCDASTRVARELVERGFTSVYAYEAGMRRWKEAGNDSEGAEAA